ncbi:thyroglobulin-like [Bolinopsis microptera]|uniref:thyroglobulin-like n=1 Tax=Bolinopsis microptera TaxID=2820187 RepID=UPI00307ACA0E
MILLTALLVFPAIFHVIETSDCKSRRELQRTVSNITAPGYYEVQCDSEDENKYVPKQCWPSTGRCWCVDTYGETIPGTHVNPGQPAPACGTFGHCTAAEQELLKGLENKMPPMGAYMPICDESGNYAKSQRWGSTGQSWCASVNGNRVPGTTTGPIEQAWDCENLPACLDKEASLAHLLVENIYPFGLDRPECDGEGKFAPTQCHGSTGHCWCVDTESGQEIEDTRQGPGEGDGPLDCVKAIDKNTFDEATASSCQRLFNAQMKHLNSFERPLLGFWSIKCEEDGSFSPSQCHPSTGHCWCVDEFGNELPGSRSTPGSPRVPCLKKQPTCSERKADLDKEIEDFMFIGMFSPKCDEDSSYMTKQCWPSTGQCWCVTKTAGTEIAYTRRGPTQKPDELDCSGVSQPPPPMKVGELRDDPGSDASQTEAVKGTSSSLIAIIAVLACVLVVVIVGGFILYRRSRTSGAKYTEVTAENPEL